MPVAHGEGCYFADEPTLDALERDGQVLFRYAHADGTAAGETGDRANPNGSLRAIAGVMNAAGNVAGPHAPPGDGGRGGPGLGRRARDHPLVRRERGRARRRRGASTGRRSRVGADDRSPRRPPRRPWPSRSTAARRHGRRARRDPRDACGRDPNDLELAMFSVMWSEHCSYKSSRPLLRTLPTARRGRRRRARASRPASSRSATGSRSRSRSRSHNHPSAVEPYQGAATGVGGILRDIFTMGARPIAVLDALRFGDPSDARTRHLVDGVVRGVGGYGNCVGVPTVGGELVFDPSYQGNPLVNVMAIGLLEERLLTRAAAPGPGNLVGAVRLDDRPRRHRRRVASSRRPRSGDDDPSKRPSASRSATRSRRSC